VFRTGRELCERLGPTPELSQVLWGLWTFHVLKAELPAALGLAGELLQLAGQVADPAVPMRGHWAMGITCTHQGRFGLALDHFDAALSLYDPEQERSDVVVDALNAGIAVRSFAGWSLWFIGQPDRALVPVQEAVALARDLSEPHGLAHALAFAAVFHQLRGERTRAQRYADEGIAVSREHGLALYQAMARIVRGWASIGRGDNAHAVEEIRQGLSAWQGTGAELLRPYFLALLAEALASTARENQALRLLDDAIGLAESTGERFYLAELYRLIGERRLAGSPARGSVAAAAACFERSLAIAAEQKALSLELRAAMSLARLQRGHDSYDSARDVVLPVYQRFQEGFDTHDLREARGLLEGNAAR
jgi:predicted ATPase